MIYSLLRRHCTVVSGILGLLPAFLCTVALADTRAFRIESKDAAAALMEFGRQAGREVFFGYEIVKNLTTNSIDGDYEPLEALRLLIKGTGLSISEQSSGILVVEPGAAAKEKKQVQRSRSDLAAVPIRLVNAPRYAAVVDNAAPAAEEERGARVSEEERDTTVVVTGSRLRRRVDTEGPNPVLTFSRERIERSGAVTLTDFVRNALPIQSGSVTDYTDFGNVGTGQSNINLRGLGNGSTLTLLDGRRFALSGNSRINGGNINNINTVPLAAVERIEILKDGASAIYGSDAIAGVVNIILRKDFRGAEANFSYGNTFDTDSAITSGSFTTGYSSGRGSGFITLDAYKQNDMLGSDRDFSASSDQRPVGGLDQRVTPGVRGTVYAMPGQTLPGVFLPGGAPATFAAIPAGQNGVGLMPADFAATAGVRDMLNQNPFMSTVPARKTINLIGSFSYEISDNLEFFGQGAYSHIDSFSYIYNVQVSLGQLVIPAANPFNPFGVDVRIEKNNAIEFGGGNRGNDYDDFGVVAGLRGNLAGSWDWEAAYVYGQSNTTNDFNPPNLNKAPVNAALTDPSLAYNWFGDPAATTVNSATQIAAIQGFENGRGNGTLSMFDVGVNGELFSFGGNIVIASLGAEFRKDHYEQAYISDSRPAATNSFTGVIQQQDRRTTSVFGELNVPLIGPQRDVPLARSLELSLAARREDLDSFGTTTDPRFGIRWQPISSLLLRASYGTSFRAPAADQVGGAVSQFFGRSVIDPKRGNTQYTILTIENAAVGLGPETSDNYSAGIVFEPEFARGLVLSLDYYRIDYQDKFAYLFPDVAVQFEDSAFGSRITRGTPSAQDMAMGWAGPIEQIVLGYVNLASTEVSGIDFEARYGWDTAFGQFTWSLLGTTTRKFDEVTVPGAAVTDQVGNYRYPKKWQGNTSLFWNRERWDAGVTFRYVDSYSWAGFGVFNPPRTVAALEEVDVQGSYQFSFGTRLTVGVNNIFDSDPPFFYAPLYYVGMFGYDNTLTSPRKASYYLNLKHEF